MPNYLSTLALLLLPLTVLTGCDGFYAYQCRGRLLDRATNDPVAPMPVVVTPGTPFDLDMYPTERTRPDGSFEYSFFIGTGWILPWRPPPPELHELYLSYRNLSGWQTIRIDGAQAEQHVTPQGARIVELQPDRVTPH